MKVTRGVLDELQELGLSYLACPYRDESRITEQGRVRESTRAAAWLHKRRVHVFSPLTHSDAIESRCKQDGRPMQGTYQDTWKGIDDAFLTRCSSLIILTIPGWDESEGVNDEIHTALDLELPIFLANPQPVSAPLSVAGGDALELRRAPYSTDREDTYVEIQNELFVK